MCIKPFTLQYYRQTHYDGTKRWGSSSWAERAGNPVQQYPPRVYVCIRIQITPTKHKHPQWGSKAREAGSCPTSPSGSLWSAFKLLSEQILSRNHSRLSPRGTQPCPSQDQVTAASLPTTPHLVQLLPEPGEKPPPKYREGHFISTTYWLHDFECYLNSLSFSSLIYKNKK